MSKYTQAMYELGKKESKEFQEKAKKGGLTGTDMYAEEEKIIQFHAAKNKKNMLEWPVGLVVKTGGGYVAKLLANYDSDTITDEPENLPEYWEVYYSKDKGKARPYNKKTAYNTGECCKYKGEVYRSLIDNNSNSPGDAPDAWELATDQNQPTEEQPETPPTDKVESWNKKTTYNTGDKVKYKGEIYESLIDNNTIEPTTDETAWKLVVVE